MFTKDTKLKLELAQMALQNQMMMLEMKLEAFKDSALEPALRDALRKSLNTNVPIVSSMLEEAKKQSESERSNIKFPLWNPNIEEIVTTLSISILEYTLLEYGDPYYGVSPLQTFSQVERRIISQYSK
jgi:hypothetical protein